MNTMLQAEHCRDCGLPLPHRPNLGIFTPLLRYCQECSDRHAQRARDAAVAASVAAWETRRLEWIEASGIPPRAMETSRLDSFDPDASEAAALGYEIAKNWEHDFSRDRPDASPWLLFFGSEGTGKTHLLLALMASALERYIPSYADVIRTERALLDATPEEYQRLTQERRRRASCPVSFWVAGELLMAIKEARRPKRFTEPLGETEHSLMNRLLTVPVLGLDELGPASTQREEEEQHHIWFLIINGRYKHGLPVLATSNVHPDQLDTVVGRAAAARLRERCAMVEMIGASYRIYRP